MEYSKNSDHLFHQEYFDKLATIDSSTQTAVLEAFPSPPKAEGLRRVAPRELGSAEILGSATLDWISKLAQLLDRRTHRARKASLCAIPGSGQL